MNKRLWILLLLCLYFFGCGAVEDGNIDKEKGIKEKGITLEIEQKTDTVEQYNKFIDDLYVFVSDLPSSKSPIRIVDSCKEKQNNEITVGEGYSLTDEDYFLLFSQLIGEEYDYGISRAIVENRIDGKSEGNDEALSEYLADESNLYILDFSRPVMENIIVDKDTSAISLDAARSFSSYIESEYGFNKLIELAKTKINDEEKVRVKNEWLKTLGIDVSYSPTAPFFFIKNEDRYTKGKWPYYIESDSYNLYISANDIKRYGYGNYFYYYTLTSDYWEEDLKGARDIFLKTDIDVPPIDIFTAFVKDEGLIGEGAIYKDGKMFLFKDFMQGLSAYEHEYTHFLQEIVYGEAAFGDDISPEIKALKEGYATELDYYEYDHLAYSACLNKDDINQLGLWDNEREQGDLGMATDITAYAMQEVEGIPYLSVSYSQETTSGEIAPYYKLGYAELASLIHYMKTIKGEEVVNEAFPDPLKFENLFDGDYEEVYIEWKEYLKERVRGKDEAINRYLNSMKDASTSGEVKE